MSTLQQGPLSVLLVGGPDPATDTGYADHPPRMGFFTDTSLCIGCKACEVACKEWNQVPEDGLDFTGMSLDNTAGLSADSWRHVAFIEQRKPIARSQASFQHGAPAVSVDGSAAAMSGGLDAAGVPGGPDDAAGVPGGQVELAPAAGGGGPTDFRWLMSSDVCKHCTHAACLDVCPTGALFRTEFGTVVVQEEVCNGCGYCVPACPYGVIGTRESDGLAHKCTLCYDRLGEGMQPACAKACPTESIQFGPLDELRERAGERVTQLQTAGVTDARLYGEDPADGVGGDGAFFLLMDDPEVYGLPPDPVVTTRDLPRMWRNAAIAAGALMCGVAAAFAGER